MFILRCGFLWSNWLAIHVIFGTELIWLKHVSTSWRSTQITYRKNQENFDGCTQEYKGHQTWDSQSLAVQLWCQTIFVSASQRKLQTWNDNATIINNEINYILFRITWNFKINQIMKFVLLICSLGFFTSTIHKIPTDSATNDIFQVWTASKIYCWTVIITFCIISPSHAKHLAWWKGGIMLFTSKQLRFGQCIIHF